MATERYAVDRSEPLTRQGRVQLSGVPPRPLQLRVAARRPVKLAFLEMERYLRSSPMPNSRRWLVAILLTKPDDTGWSGTFTPHSPSAARKTRGHHTGRATDDGSSSVAPTAGQT